MNQHWPGIAVGILIVWVLELAGIAPQIGLAEIHVGTLGYVFLCLASLPVAWSRPSGWLDSAWTATAAIILTDAPTLASRAPGLDARLVELAFGTGLTLAVVPFAGLLLVRFETRLRPARLDALIACGAAVVPIALFQLANRWLRNSGVPNEERSLIIAGIEVHHINWGFVLVILVVGLGGLVSNSRSLRIAWSAALGCGLGLVWDEWFYYLRAQVTDEAYFLPSTVAAAFLMPAVALALWWKIAAPAGDD